MRAFYYGLLTRINLCGTYILAKHDLSDIDHLARVASTTSIPRPVSSLFKAGKFRKSPQDTEFSLLIKVSVCIPPVG